MYLSNNFGVLKTIYMFGAKTVCFMCYSIKVSSGEKTYFCISRERLYPNSVCWLGLGEWRKTCSILAERKGKCLFLSLCLPQYYAHVSVFHFDKFTFIYLLSFQWHLAATLPLHSPATPYSTHPPLQRSFRITTFNSLHSTSLPTAALASAWAPALCT